MRGIQADKLRDYCSRLFEKEGVPAGEAFIIADSLVEADLAGVESHGVSRVANYLKKLRAGGAHPAVKLKTIMDGPGTGVYDAGDSMGAPAAYNVMEIAIEKAKKVGIAFVTVINSSHYGTAGYFAKMALTHDMIGLTATNSVSTMAPWGGKAPFFGTNPFAVAIPAQKHSAIVADMATSVVARGKIRMAFKKNQPIPLGWARSQDGEDTTDAGVALKGTVLPFGGYKGSAIATIIEALTGVLGGSVFGTQITGMDKAESPARVSHCFMAIDLARFGPVGEFKKRVDQMIAGIKGTPRAKNVEEIFLPGEIEERKKQQRLKDGIPLARVTLDELKREGAACGITYTLE